MAKTLSKSARDRPPVSPAVTAFKVDPGNGNPLIPVPSPIAVLPVRSIVVFPGTVVTLNIGRPKSRLLLDSLDPQDKPIAVVNQRDSALEDPSFKALHSVGTIATILRAVRLPDGNQSVVVHGLARVRLIAETTSEPFLLATIARLRDHSPTGKELQAVAASVRQLATRAWELSSMQPTESVRMLESARTPAALSDYLASTLPLDETDKQALLEDADVLSRLRTIAVKLASHVDVLELQQKIQAQVKQSLDKSQRRFFLTEQLRVIQHELGDFDALSPATEIHELQDRLTAAAPPVVIMREALRELRRLESTPVASPEYGVIRSHLQLLGELPWNKRSVDNLDLDRARRILDRDHDGLERIKRRVIEFLAVRRLSAERNPTPSTASTSALPGQTDGSRSGRGAVLCLVGPPGVGKTSLGRSIASALGRHFIRIALGGVRDEADIRGHRRTYIASMPGRIVSELRKCGTRNPVVVLDEIDKMAADYRGDPCAALLEVLDPAQNHAFTDHYVDGPFDLSDILFIATANSIDGLPGPLRDRLEILELSGYTTSEKLRIARRHLVPRQIAANALRPTEVTLPAPLLRQLIEGYTRESGVRSLERAIGSVCRAMAARIVDGNAASTPAKRGAKPSLVATTRDLTEALGPIRFEPEVADSVGQVGVATGLAYTPLGGEILFIEAAQFPGTGKITLTGQMGEVMRESATAALTAIKSRTSALGVDPVQLSNSDLHIHVPAGAVAKDGPSAGLAILAAMVSLLTDQRIPSDTAMTGEITLRGRVLPVGGMREKLVAARRAGIHTVIIPHRNLRDLDGLPKETLRGLKIRPIDSLAEALSVLFGRIG